jgi:hypothetical protein
MHLLNLIFRSLAVVGCLAIVGCERAERSGSSGTMSSNSLAGLKGETPVRYLCTYCGAWRETDSVKLIVSLSDGAKPGSADEKAIADAKKTEAPFMLRHLEKCGRKGGMVVGVYPEDPRWKRLDSKKREN